MRLIVIGGGAAGFFCAVTAAKLNPTLEIKIVEKTSKVLSKVRISGGGRCNVTHGCFDIEQMMRNYPRGANFVKKTFYQFFTTDTIQWFGERGVKLKQEEDGRMFPVSDSSESIINCLIQETNRHRIELQMQKSVSRIAKENERWKLEYADDSWELTDYICVACGGFPKVSMFEWLTATGHTIEAPVPSLFTFNMPGNPIRELMGISVEKVVVKVKGTKLSSIGPLLITHWGMSGPAILKLSAWGAREFNERNYHFSILVNWLPHFNEHSLREHLKDLRVEFAGHPVHAKNSFGLPQRLWQFLVDQSGVSQGKRWADLTGEIQNRLIKNLVDCELEVQGKTTYKEEFVTAGGVKLSEVNAASMESKLQPGLFFAGEILDVDGITGGFNFQHAWTSGYIAGKSISQRSLEATH